MKRSSYVSVKGARSRNEDAVINNENMMAVFDGHGGTHMSYMLRDKFYQEYMNQLEKLTDGDIPKQVRAFDKTFEVMNTFDTESGSTAVITYKDDEAIWVACVGDSQAFLIDPQNGSIVQGVDDSWDFETNGPALTFNNMCMTNPHGLSGYADANNVITDDPIGTKEYKLMREKFPYSSKVKKPWMEGLHANEKRFRCTELEPTRAVGDKGYHILRRPEVFKWNLKKAQGNILILTCDGFQSKNAFPETERLFKFMIDPKDYIMNTDFLDNTVAKLKFSDKICTYDIDNKETLTEKIDALYKFSHSLVCKDIVWRNAVIESYNYVKNVVASGSIPNMNTDLEETLLLATHMAILMLSDDNVTAIATNIQKKRKRRNSRSGQSKSPERKKINNFQQRKHKMLRGNK